MHGKIFEVFFMCDRIGRPLKVGDKVVVLCTITAADECSLILETVYGGPGGAKEAIGPINAMVTDLADYAPAGE